MTGKAPISSLNQNSFHKDPSHALFVLASLRNDRNARWDMSQIFLSKVSSREAHWVQGKNVGLEIHSSGLGRSSGGGHGNPLQYSCLERSLEGYSS